MRNYDLEFLKHFSMVIAFLAAVTLGLILFAHHLNGSVEHAPDPAAKQRVLDRIAPAGAVYAGATGADMAAAQVGRSDDPRTAAALAFALKVVGQRAQVDDADFTNLRTAGFDDGQIVEIMAHVALNLFTNYINVALDVPVDFPRVALK